MTRVKQFADDLAISTKKAKNLINKGRSRKDGGSQILESVMADKTKDKKKKKNKSEKLKPQLMPYIKGGRAKRDESGEINPQIMPYIKGGRAKRDDSGEINPQLMPYIKAGRANMADGGSNVTKINKDKLSKAQMGQFRNIQSDAVKGKITSAEAEKMIRKLVLNKKDGGATDFGMLSVKAGIDKNPRATKADRIAGATMKEKTVNKAKGGGIAIQGLGFTGVK